MPTRRTRSRRATAAPAAERTQWSEALRLIRHDHAEVYTHSRTGEQILVRCECPIGRDHSYEEWASAYAGNEALAQGLGRNSLPA